MPENDISTLVAQACSPGRFFLSAGGSMRLVGRGLAETRWEIFRGHLLDASQTRATRELESWDLLFRWPGDDADQPLISFHWDQAAGQLHVTRGILTYGWEAYESSPNTIESRETQVWRRELVASLDVTATTTDERRAGAVSPLVSLAKQLALTVERAIVGASRLPITSLESPLPAFSLGRLAYFPFLNPVDSDANAICEPDRLIERVLPVAGAIADQARLLEVVLRSASLADLSQLAAAFYQHARDKAGLPAVVREMFGQLALSPYTGIGERLVAWLDAWSSPGMLGVEAAIELIGYMMRHLVRHLTAFDLVTFHNRGANYPDALFLDDFLKALMRYAEQRPDLFVGNNRPRMRRRALRQGWLIRRIYEGHPVPVVPTSPGENLRVLPPEFPRASDEELLHAVKRRQKLFVDDPLETLVTNTTRAIVATAVADLEQPNELRELGMATFLDRPMGIAKAPGEVDRTPLLSYEAFSREIVLDRLKELRRYGLIADDATRDRLIAAARALPVTGLPVAAFNAPDRPGAAALEDAKKAAEDFVFLRTTRRSLNDFLRYFNLEPLSQSSPYLAAWLTTGRDVLLIRDPGVTTMCLLALDKDMQRRAEMFPARPDLVVQRFAELPRDGLFVRSANCGNCEISLRCG